MFRNDQVQPTRATSDREGMFGSGTDGRVSEDLAPRQRQAGFRIEFLQPLLDVMCGRIFPSYAKLRRLSEGIEFSWLSLPSQTCELVIVDYRTKVSIQHVVNGSRIIVNLPPGEYHWRVRILRREETATDRKRIKIHSDGRIEWRRLSPANRSRIRQVQVWFSRKLQEFLARSKRALRRRLKRPSKGSRRFTRLVEISVFSWRVWRALPLVERNAIWIAHDLYAVPVTFLLAKLHGGRFVYDAVEMSFGRCRQTAPGWLSRGVILSAERMCRRADCVLAGCPYLKKDLEARHAGIRPVLFLNGQEDLQVDFPSTYLREQTGQTSDVPLVLYVGHLWPGRGLDETVRAVQHLEVPAHLVMMGPSAAQYDRFLRDLAAKLGVTDRVSILAPVPEEKVVWAASSANLGISPVSRSFGNGRYVLNNRLFQYIAAGLPVIASDVEGVGGFVLSERIGDVFDERDPQAIATCVNKILSDEPRLRDLKARTREVARKYSWNGQKRILVESFSAIGGGQRINSIGG